jgi:2,5-diamino-6-(ribosylamino)-4(3H)-pyrimidinone 5'-phosphate reductase
MIAKGGDEQPTDRPFIFINMAMTADGKIATADRVVSSFGSKRDQEHLYELRATADAVMAGARTIDSNKIKLGPGGERFRQLRLRNKLAEFNLRVVVSGSGTIDPRAAIFQHRFSPIIVLTSERASKTRLKLLRSLSDDVYVAGEEQVDFRLALRHLRTKWQVKRLLCEGGGELNNALFEAALVDELHLTICPRVFGGSAAPTIAEGRGARQLQDAAKLELESSSRVGDELFLVYRVKRPRGT